MSRPRIQSFVLAVVLLATPLLAQERSVSYTPGPRNQPIVLRGNERVTLARGVYVFSGLSEPAIQVYDSAQLTIPDGVTITLGGPSGDGLLVEAGATDPPAVVRVEGATRSLSSASIQGRILLRVGRLEVTRITLHRPYHLVAAAGGDTALEGGAALILTDAATQAPPTGGDHDTVANDSFVDLVRSEYRQGSIYMNNGGLWMVDSSIGVCLFPQGKASLDLLRSHVDAFGPILGEGTSEFVQNGTVTPDRSSWRYARNTYNVRPDGTSAADKADAAVFSWVLEDTTLSAWLFDVTDAPSSRVGTRLTLKGFEELPAGLGLLLHFEKTGAGGSVDIGRLPAGAIRHSGYPDRRFDAFCRLRTLAGIDLTLERCFISGWNVYTGGSARIRAACQRLFVGEERIGVFYESEAWGNSKLDLYHSDVLAGYLSAEESAEVLVSDCFLRRATYDVRCVGRVGSHPLLRLVRCKFESPSTEPRRLIALDGGRIEVWWSGPRSSFRLVRDAASETYVDGMARWDEELR